MQWAKKHNNYEIKNILFHGIKLNIIINQNKIAKDNYNWNYYLSFIMILAIFCNKLVILIINFVYIDYSWNLLCKAQKNKQCRILFNHFWFILWKIWCTEQFNYEILFAMCCVFGFDIRKYYAWQAWNRWIQMLIFATIKKSLSSIQSIIHY